MDWMGDLSGETVPVGCRSYGAAMIHNGKPTLGATSLKNPLSFPDEFVTVTSGGRLSVRGAQSVTSCHLCQSVSV